MDFSLLPTSITPLDLMAVSELVREAHGVWSAWATGPSETLKHARGEEFNRLVYFGAQQLQALLQRVESLENASATFEVMKARWADHQFQRIQENYRLELWREALDERKFMLVYAAVQSFKIDLSIAQAARVERVLRELDPPDVLLLLDILRIDAAEPEDFSRRLQTLCEARLASSDVLMTAGCLMASGIQWTGTLPPSRVTELGRLVGVLMGGYEPWINSPRDASTSEARSTK